MTKISSSKFLILLLKLTLLQVLLQQSPLLFQQPSTSFQKQGQSFFVLAQPYCQTPQILNKSNVYQSMGEILETPLSMYFQGYNLSFSIQESNPTGFSIIQPSQLSSQSSNGALVSSIIAVSDPWPLSNGSVVISALQKDGNNNYFMLFATLQNGAQDAPDFFAQGRQPVPLQTDNATQCFDITLLQEDLAVVDCQHGSANVAYETWLFVGSMFQSVPVTFQVGSVLQQSPVQGRNSLQYVLNGKFYLLSFTPFNQGTFLPENYVDVYFYNSTNVSQDYPFGTLNYVQVLTGSDFGLSSDSDLKIVDIQALNSYLYLLDHNLGMICFQYQSNKVLNLQSYDLALKNVSLWGFGLTNIGGQNVLVIASELRYLFEYSWMTVDSEPVMTNQYETPFENAQGLIQVQVSANFVSAQAGKLLSVYQRSVQNADSERIFAAFTNFDFAQLLGATDNFIAYQSQSGVVSNYRLWRRPTLTVQQHQWQSIHIIASSNYLGDVVQCTILLNFLVVPQSADTQIQKAGLTLPQQYDMAGDYGATIPLGVQFYGPNIQYSAAISRAANSDTSSTAQPSSSSQSSSSSSSNTKKLEQEPANDQPVLNVPAVAKIVENGVDVTQVIFTRLFVINEDQYYALHQITNNTVLIYFCQATQQAWLSIQCTEQPHASVNLSGPISTYAEFTWHGLDMWMVVTSDALGSVFGYDFGGVSRFNQTYPDTQIDHIAVGNNQIYAIIEKEGITAVLILTYDTTLITQAYITAATVANYPNGQNFQPVSLYAPMKEFPGLLVIKSENYVSLLSVTDSADGPATFLANIIPVMPLNSQEWAVVVGSQASLLLIFDGPNGVIQEYSLIDVTNPTFIKNYPLYDNWTVFQPLSFSFSKGTHLLYVVMQQAQQSLQQEFNNNNQNIKGQPLQQTPQKMQTAIFVYRTGLQPEIQTLYNVLNLPTTTNIANANMSVCGQTTDTLYVRFDSSSIRIYRVPLYPSLYIPPQLPFDSTQYLERLVLTITMQPWNDPAGEVSVSYNLTTVNSGTDVQVNTAEIQKQDVAQLLQIPDNNNTQLPYNRTFLDRQWFFGQVLGYNATCLNCSNAFQFFNHIQMAQPMLPDFTEQPPIDIYTDPESGLIYVLTKYTIKAVFPNNLTQVYQQVYLGVDSPNYCSRLVPQHQSTGGNALIAFYVLCYQDDRDQYGVLFLQFDPTNIYSPPKFPYNQQLITLITIQKVGDAQFIDGLLLVANVGVPKGMMPATEGAVYAFQMNFQNMEAQIVQAFDANNLKYQFTNLTSFDVWPQDNFTRVIMLANNNSFLFFVTVAPQDYTTFLQMQQFDVQGFLQQKGLVLPTKAQIVKTLFLYKSNAIINNEGVQYQVLLVTDIVSHFELELFFNQSNAGLCEYGSSSVPRVYAAYGLSKATNRVRLFYQNRVVQTKSIAFLFTVQYFDAGNNKLTLALYNRFKAADVVPTDNLGQSVHEQQFVQSMMQKQEQIQQEYQIQQNNLKRKQQKQNEQTNLNLNNIDDNNTKKQQQQTPEIKQTQSTQQPPLITMAGGIEFEEVYYPDQFVSNFIYNSLNFLEPQLICSNQKDRSMAFLNYNFLLKLQVNSLDFQNQTIQLQAVSDFAAPDGKGATIDLPVSKLPPYVPPQPSPSRSSDGSNREGSNNWWIALLIIGIMIVLGALLVAFCKKKQGLDEFQEENTISLQTHQIQ